MYVRLAEGAAPEQMAAQLPGLVARRGGEAHKEALAESGEISLVRLVDIHLRHQDPARVLYLMAAAVAIILVIAASTSST